MKGTVSVGVDAIRAAAVRITGFVHCTPVLHSTLIDEVTGCTVLFKCENLQKGGAFKARGAHNAVLSLTPAERSRGVATHSSGNHAAALAMAAERLQIPAYIVMPENAPAPKVAAVRAYGGEITFCAATQAARESALAALCARTGAVFIPPYDDNAVIAGQGTCALELAKQLEAAPDALLAPVGGGGLLAGSAVASRAVWPDTEVIGAEPAGADDARRGFLARSRLPQTAPHTIADGLRTALGERNFPLILGAVDDILTADDSTIIAAMRLVMTRLKLVVEPSAVLGLAVLMQHPQRFAGKRVAVILTGGNVDLDALPW
ncbi:MAG: pyridoxal-phosphate dependent enzyme [Halioglobus sp.]|nr:pyridoxal-phosphate dependent enzyme [Halioglobus sp.]